MGEGVLLIMVRILTDPNVCSLGWNDFMGVAAFTDPEAGYLCNNTATFSASFHIIKESSTFNRSIERGLVPKGRNNRAKGGPSEHFCCTLHASCCSVGSQIWNLIQV